MQPATVAPWAKKTTANSAEIIRLRAEQKRADELSYANQEQEVTPSGFKTPIRCIRSQIDVDMWLRSPMCADWLRWLQDCSEAVIGCKNSTEVAMSPCVEALVEMLGTMKTWAEEIEPAEQQSRYGNKSYRIWHDKVSKEARQLVERTLPQDDARMREAAVELGMYLSESIGNATRIDYGTGHEMAFSHMLYCYERLGALQPTVEEHRAVVLRVFVAYISLMRLVQTRYMLEPAGSHGVWSLDDYHFLPFYFGAAQFRHAKEDITERSLPVKPSAMRDRAQVEALADDYMLMDAVRFVMQVKSGPFGEHSPMLNDISHVPLWFKVNTGLLKMYKAEVLCKFPVMQHVKFGTLLPFEEPQADAAN